MHSKILGSEDVSSDLPQVPKRAVVTGAGGFIGSHITKLLAEQGCSVHGIGHSEMSDQDQQTLSLDQWYSGGISASTLAAASRDAEIIYHCAGSGSVPLSLREPMVDFRKNVVTTAEVLNFSREHGQIPVVYLSSAGVYGIARDMPIKVTAPCNPVSPYGINKQIGEILVRQYATHFQVPSVIVRLFSVYGEGLRKQLLWDACHKLSKGDLLFFGTGDETRDWIHVEDAAELIVQAGRMADEAVPILNGATGEKTKIREVVEKLASFLEVSQPVQFNGKVRPGDPRDYVADITDSLSAGWQPRISLEAGIAKYAIWFQETIQKTAQ